jgi:hypothetical protein
MVTVRQEALLTGIEEMMKLHRACLSIIESMLPTLDESVAGDWRLFEKTLNRHWRCWSQRATELRQQVVGLAKGSVEATSSTFEPGGPKALSLEALLEQHRRQYSSLDSDAAASRDYRTMCIARTQLAEALACEEKLSKNRGPSPVRLRLAS